MHMYIRRTLSCCICHVFHSVFSVYVHLMYIFLSLFSVDGFYCAILLDIVLICCCTPGNDIDSPSPDMGRHSWYQSYRVRTPAAWGSTCGSLRMQHKYP